MYAVQQTYLALLLIFQLPHRFLNKTYVNIGVYINTDVL